SGVAVCKPVIWNPNPSSNPTSKSLVEAAVNKVKAEDQLLSIIPLSISLPFGNKGNNPSIYIRLGAMPCLENRSKNPHEKILGKYGSALKEKLGPSWEVDWSPAGKNHDRALWTRVSTNTTIIKPNKKEGLRKAVEDAVVKEKIPFNKIFFMQPSSVTVVLKT